MASTSTSKRAVASVAPKPAIARSVKKAGAQQSPARAKGPPKKLPRGVLGMQPAPGGGFYVVRKPVLKPTHLTVAQIRAAVAALIAGRESANNG